MKVLYSLLFLTLPSVLFAQGTDSLPATQLSYSLNVYAPFTPSRKAGAFFDVEGRFHRNFSWLGTLGFQHHLVNMYSRERLPLNMDTPPLPPDWPRSREAGAVDGQARWFYLGAGGQVNLRIGSGDVSIGGLLTIARQHYRQLIHYGDVRLPTIVNPAPGGDTLGPPAGLFGTAEVTYRPLVQLGGRVQLHYSRWFSRTVAVRAGIVFNDHGFATWGSTRPPDQTSASVRYEVKRTDYSTPLRPGIDNYGLPDSEVIGTPDPTNPDLQVTYLLGVIYKPAKYAPR